MNDLDLYDIFDEHKWANLKHDKGMIFFFNHKKGVMMVGPGGVSAINHLKEIRKYLISIEFKPAKHEYSFNINDSSHVCKMNNRIILNFYDFKNGLKKSYNYELELNYYNIQDMENMSAKDKELYHTMLLFIEDTLGKPIEELSFGSFMFL